MNRGEFNPSWSVLQQTHLHQLCVGKVAIFPVIQENQIKRFYPKLLLHFGDPVTRCPFHQLDLEGRKHSATWPRSGFFLLPAPPVLVVLPCLPILPKRSPGELWRRCVGWTPGWWAWRQAAAGWRCARWSSRSRFPAPAPSPGSLQSPRSPGCTLGVEGRIETYREGSLLFFPLIKEQSYGL